MNKCPYCNKDIEILTKTKIDILKLVKSNKYNITEISNKIGICYKNIHKHLNDLEGMGLIKREIVKHKCGAPKVNIITKEGKKYL